MGDASLAKCLLYKHVDLCSGPNTHIKARLGCWGQAETGEFLGYTDQPTQCAQQVPGSDSLSKTEVETGEGNQLTSGLHTYMGTYMGTHAYTQTTVTVNQ